MEVCSVQPRSIYWQGRGQGQPSSNCHFAVGWAWHLGDRGENVSLAPDLIQPSTDLRRALMTKQFSRPKYCLSIVPDWESLSHVNLTFLSFRWFLAEDALQPNSPTWVFVVVARKDLSWFLLCYVKMTGELLLHCSVSVSHAECLAHWLEWAAVAVCVIWPVCAMECEANGCCFRVSAGVGLNGPVQEAGLSLVAAHSLSVLLLSHHY